MLIRLTNGVGTDLSNAVQTFEDLMVELSISDSVIQNFIQSSYETDAVRNLLDTTLSKLKSAIP